MADLDTEILIVGAGIAGAATAYHLVRNSNRRVLIVEKESVPGFHSSGRNASFVREQMEHAVLQPLATQGAEFLRSQALARYEQCGLFLLGQGEQDVRKHIPVARGRGVLCPLDGVVDVAGLLQAYLDGQDVRFDTEVLRWEHVRGKLRVETNRDMVQCDVLVNACGPWAGRLGDLPLTPFRRHIFVTPPTHWVRPDWPLVWDAEGGYYFRPESGGLLLSPCDETPSEPGDYAEDPATLEELAEKLTTRQPQMSDISIQSSWVGQRTFAPDRSFVIGFDPRDQRVFHVAGLGGHGVTASYAVGKLAAELITDPSAESTNPFSPSRLL